MQKDQDREPVVAVCGNEALVYGPKEANGIRPFLRARQFAHHGAALQWADEFENPLAKQGRKATAGAA